MTLFVKNITGNSYEKLYIL